MPEHAATKEETKTDNSDALTNQQRNLLQYMNLNTPSLVDRLTTMEGHSHSLTRSEVFSLLGIQKIEEFMNKVNKLLSQGKDLTSILQVDVEYFTTQEFHKKAAQQIARQSAILREYVKKGNDPYFLELRDDLAYIKASQAYK